MNRRNFLGTMGVAGQAHKVAASGETAAPARKGLTRERYRGVFAYPPTPFADDLSLDEQALRSNIRKLVRLGVEGIEGITHLDGQLLDAEPPQCLQELPSDELYPRTERVHILVGGPQPAVEVVQNREYFQQDFPLGLLDCEGDISLGAVAEVIEIRRQSTVMVHQLRLAPEEILHLELGIGHRQFQVNLFIGTIRGPGEIGEIHLWQRLRVVLRSHLVRDGLEVAIERLVQVEIHDVFTLPEGGGGFGMWLLGDIVGHRGSISRKDGWVTRDVPACSGPAATTSATRP